MSSAVAESVFSTIPRSNYLGLFNESGTKNNYKKVTDFLSFTNEDVARIAEVSKNSVRYDEKMPDIVRQRLMEIATICELVAGFFEGNPDKTAMWFKAPNPMFGNMSPRDMIRAGRYAKVLKIVRQSLQGIIP